jgi:hypothetical protein
MKVMGGGVSQEVLGHVRAGPKRRLQPRDPPVEHFYHNSDVVGDCVKTGCGPTGDRRLWPIICGTGGSIH